MARFRDFDQLEVIAPNFKRRLSGVTSTIVQLVPEQARQGLGIATLGPGLPLPLPKLRYVDLWRLWTRPTSGKPRIWHARRNVEMLAGIFLRDGLRMPLKLVFTSAAQRHHRDFTKWMIGRMDSVVATSQRSADFLDVQTMVIMHGIDTNRFAPSNNKSDSKQDVGLDPKRKFVGCTGRIRPSKGTDLFVDAMIEILPKHPTWDAVITGRSTAEHETFQRSLEAKVSAAGLSKRIRFFGEVPDILPWYQAFDLFVAPSRNEGFGLTPLEAMACSVPCVTSDAGSYAEMHPEAGAHWCVEADNRAALEAALTEALSYFNNTKGVASLARKHVQAHFSLGEEARKLIGLYRSIV